MSVINLFCDVLLVKVSLQLICLVLEFWILFVRGVHMVVRLMKLCVNYFVVVILQELFDFPRCGASSGMGVWILVWEIFFNALWSLGDAFLLTILMRRSFLFVVITLDLIWQIRNGLIHEHKVFCLEDNVLGFFSEFKEVLLCNPPSEVDQVWRVNGIKKPPMGVINLNSDAAIRNGGIDQLVDCHRSTSGCLWCDCVKRQNWSSCYCWNLLDSSGG